jgi:hypothetical protein
LYIHLKEIIIKFCKSLCCINGIENADLAPADGKTEKYKQLQFIQMLQR